MGRHFLLYLFILIQASSLAQEYTGNTYLRNAAYQVDVAHKLSALSLPFRDDFSRYDSTHRPQAMLWLPSGVYVNNQFDKHSLNQGMATLDGLDANGYPYAASLGAVVYADTLTSQAIDISSFSVGNNLVLSFHYLPRGLGQQPLAADSLLVYGNSSTEGWKLLATVAPDTISKWRIKVIQLLDNGFFHENFQFRFINKSTMGLAPSHWHIDNVYLNKDRGVGDTAMAEVAFTAPPHGMLKDFTAMPFKHFNTDKAAFLRDKFEATIFNNRDMPFTAPVTLHVRNAATMSLVHTSAAVKSMGVYERDTVTMPMMSPTAFNPGADGKLTLNCEYSVISPSLDLWKHNDTIQHRQVFDNYFAYDDGSSELSYYLNLYPSAPGKIAIEYKNYVPDTVAGIDIQFANPTPSQADKEFFIQIYQGIEEGSSSGTLIYEQQGYYPSFPQTNAGFARYVFDEVVPLPEGQFYVVIMMPTGGVSDSLMIGLDRNRIEANHRYYSVEDIWLSSTVEGALMVRPIMSSTKLPMGVQDDNRWSDITVYPNPVMSYLSIKGLKTEKKYEYVISDITGRTNQSGHISAQPSISVKGLKSGLYFITIHGEKGIKTTHKFIKQ